MSDDTSRLDVSVTHGASAVTVSVAGELDIATGESLVQRVGAAIADATPGELILDAAELRFCDSAGINALVRSRKIADGHGWRFALVNAQSPVRRVLELTGLHDYLNLDGEPTA